MKMVNSIQHRGLHTPLPVGNRDAFSVSGQAIDRRAVSVQEPLTRDAVTVFWKCVCHFYSVEYDPHTMPKSWRNGVLPRLTGGKERS
jgi:hypothetical protein